MRVDDKYLKYIVSIKGPVTVLLATHENSSTELAHDVEITHVFQELMQLLYAENAKKIILAFVAEKAPTQLEKLQITAQLASHVHPTLKPPNTVRYAVFFHQDSPDPANLNIISECALNALPLTMAHVIPANATENCR